MENWVTFLSVNVVLAIVLGVITNLATPWVKAAYERSVFSSKKKRIARLIKDFRARKVLSENPNRLLFTIIRNFIDGLTRIVFYAVSSVTIYLLFAFFLNNAFAKLYFGIGFWLFFGFNTIRLFIGNVKLIDDSIEFSYYSAGAKIKMSKLGGNPEDLDKEEGS